MQHFDQEKTLCFIELMFRQDKSVIVLKVTLCFTSERTDGQNRTRPEHVQMFPSSVSSTPMIPRFLSFCCVLTDCVTCNSVLL